MVSRGADLRTEPRLDEAGGLHPGHHGLGYSAPSVVGPYAFADGDILDGLPAIQRLDEGAGTEAWETVCEQVAFGKMLDLRHVPKVGDVAVYGAISSVCALVDLGDRYTFVIQSEPFEGRRLCAYARE